METLENLARTNWPSMIGVAVLIFFAGITLAAKADSKWGYVIAALGAVLALFVLRTNGII